MHILIYIRIITTIVCKLEICFAQRDGPYHASINLSFVKILQLSLNANLLSLFAKNKTGP